MCCTYNVRRHREEIRDRWVGEEDLQYDTLWALTHFQLRSFQSAWHSYGYHRNRGSEEMVPRSAAPWWMCAALSKWKKKHETTEGELIQLELIQVSLAGLCVCMCSCAHSNVWVFHAQVGEIEEQLTTARRELAKSEEANQKLQRDVKEVGQRFSSRVLQNNIQRPMSGKHSPTSLPI